MFGGFNMEVMDKEIRSLLVNLMIKQLRIDNRLTQTQLAEKIGCSQREIWRYEKPGYKVSPRRMIDLVEALGTDVDTLFGYKECNARKHALEELREMEKDDIFDQFGSDEEWSEFYREQVNFE